jgi:hypothetical protein
VLLLRPSLSLPHPTSQEGLSAKLCDSVTSKRRMSRDPLPPFAFVFFPYLSFVVHVRIGYSTWELC